MVAIKTTIAKQESVALMHNRLLHRAVRSAESAVSKAETNLTSISGTNVRGALPVVPISVHGQIGPHEDTMVLCDTGWS